jgi:tripartite-type tricarboxylate transporter receptor subunit TctC
LLASPPPLVINQNLYRNLPSDPLKFEPIIVMAKVPNALIVNPNNVKSPNLSELIEYWKKQSRQDYRRHARKRNDLASYV